MSYLDRGGYEQIVNTMLHNIAKPAGHPFRDETALVVLVVALLGAAVAYWWFERRK